MVRLAFYVFGFKGAEAGSVRMRVPLQVVLAMIKERDPHHAYHLVRSRILSGQGLTLHRIPPSAPRRP